METVRSAMMKSLGVGCHATSVEKAILRDSCHPGTAPAIKTKRRRKRHAHKHEQSWMRRIDGLSTPPEH